MGAVTGLVGLGGGAGGTSFAGPQAAQITNPTNSSQISTAYGGTQNSLTAQQNLLQALQAQNGISNQNQVYNQLQGIASGAVNPAQAQFNQNTSANVANQAALMAGQRGAGANVGLIARQAAQQGAGIQQQAVGQEATQQAQNQIGAIGAAGNLATTQAGQAIGQTNANASAQQAEQSNLLNALQGYNTNQVASQSNINSANAGLANTQLQGQQGIIGGAMQGIGVAAGAAGGGELIKMAGGGDAASPSLGVTIPTASDLYGNAGTFAQFVNSTSNYKTPSNQNSAPMAAASGPGALQQGTSSLISGLSKKFGGQNMNQQAAGDASFYAPGQVGMAIPGAAEGGMAKDFRTGGKVNASSAGQKASQPGNNYSNDKIPAVLSEHEIVLPRSVTLSKDPIRESAKFVAKVIAQRKGGK